jgi:hypothetical protein
MASDASLEHNTVAGSWEMRDQQNPRPKPASGSLLLLPDEQQPQRITLAVPAEGLILYYFVRVQSPRGIGVPAAPLLPAGEGDRGCCRVGYCVWITAG